MVRPNSAVSHPPSLFRVIKVPVARHHNDNASKPNPTIAKKLGGYHRRVVAQDNKNKRNLFNIFKTTIRKIKDAFRLPSSPLIRRIQELEDDIKLLRQKNEILEKGYTVSGNIELDDLSCGGVCEESSSTRSTTHEDAITEEGEATPVVVERAAAAAAPAPVASDLSVLPIPVPPPAPPLGSVPTASARNVPEPPPAPVVGAPALSRRGHLAGAPPCANLSKFERSSSGGGININDILNVQLRPVQPIRKLDTEPGARAFQVRPEDLFSVPLKPVGRRPRRPLRAEDESDNDDFRILRAAMKKRVDSLYSPSVSVAASDTEWSASPGFRSRPVETYPSSGGAVPT